MVLPMPDIKIKAEQRTETGSASARRLRRTGKIPGVIYGGGVDPIAVTVESRALRSALTSDAGLNALLDVEVGGSSHLVVTRELQRNPVKGTVSHIDFQVVRRDQVITADIPVNLVGEPTQVNLGGGRVEQQLFTLPIKATPAEIPSSVEVDISNLAMGGTIKVSDLVLAGKVSIEADGDITIAVAIGARGVGQADGEGDTGAGSGEGDPESHGSSGSDATSSN